MNTRFRRHGRAIAIALAVIALVAGHGVVLYGLSNYVIESAAIASAVVVVVVLKHVGLIGAVGAPLWRRMSRRRSERKNG